jgi:hypothetical protein
MQIGERGPAGHVKQDTVPTKPDLTADGSVPVRLNRSHVSELCLCSDELPLGPKEKLVLLKLHVLAADRAAVPLEASFQSHNEASKLQIESGLPAANGFIVRFAVSGNVKRGEAAALSDFATAALVVAVDHFVELLRKIDISGVFVGIEVIETPTDIDPDIKSAPIARIGRVQLLEKIFRA